MKKAFVFVFALLASQLLLSQDFGFVLLKYILQPQNKTIEVWANLTDHRLDPKNPFSYFWVISSRTGEKRELTEDEMRKEFKIKIKKNKKINEDSYILKFNSIKEYDMYLNYHYGTKSYLFYTRMGEKWMYSVTDIYLNYNPEKPDKLKSVKVRSLKMPTGSLHFREYER